MRKKPNKLSADTGMVGNTKKNRNHATRWTLTEIAFLEKHYGKLPAKEVAISMGRGVSAVRAMVLKVGVGRSGAKPWEPWEIGIVKNITPMVKVSQW